MRPFSIQSIPKPISQNALAQGEISWPVDIEIGAGVGLHGIQYSKNYRDRRLIAFERTKEKFNKFYRRYENHGQPGNLFPIHGDGLHWISHYVPFESVERYFILYPNPYPKNKQANLRFPNMPFMEQLIKTMVKGGVLTLATNKQNYAEESAEKFVDIWGLELQSWEKWQEFDQARTHFEKKYLERGEICHNLILRKTF